MSLRDGMKKMSKSDISDASRINLMDEKDEILITGGGSYNNFWIKKLKEFKVNIVIPNSILIDFKEALIFALLGVLKMRNEENSLSSVTGSSKNLKTGTIYDS